MVLALGIGAWLVYCGWAGLLRWDAVVAGVVALTWAQYQVWSLNERFDRIGRWIAEVHDLVDEVPNLKMNLVQLVKPDLSPENIAQAIHTAQAKKKLRREGLSEEQADGAIQRRNDLAKKGLGGGLTPAEDSEYRALADRMDK